MVPPKLADVLALQRAEEPEPMPSWPAGQIPVEGAELPDDGFDFALSADPAVAWLGMRTAVA